MCDYFHVHNQDNGDEEEDGESLYSPHWQKIYQNLSLPCNLVKQVFATGFFFTSDSDQV